MTQLTWAREELTLLPDRAVLWPSARTLIVADLHLGKAASFRAGGVPVPEGATQRDLARLTRLIREHDILHLVILGDMLHARAARSAETLGALEDWRAAHPDLDITLIRGNHDRSAGDPPESLRIRALDEPAPYTCPRGSARTSALRFAHQPPAAAPEDESSILCGHVHPAITLSHRSGAASMSAPAFVFTPRVAILPAFGTFTGTARITPRRGDRVFAVGPDDVVEVS